MTDANDNAGCGILRHGAAGFYRLGISMTLACFLAAACGGGDNGRESETEPKPASSEAPSTERATASEADGWRADALCDALDIDAIAAIRGITAEVVENADRSMFEHKVAMCHIFQDTRAGGVRITVYDPSSARWIVNKGGGVKEPLEEQPLSEPISGPGDRTVFVWNTADRSSPQAAIYHLVVDYAGVTVNIRFEGNEVDRSPETFKAVAEQVRSDLGL